MSNNSNASRRGVLVGATAIAASAVLPAWAVPVEAATLSQAEPLLRRVCLPPFGPSPSRVNWCLGIFEKAAGQYEATGETEDLQVLGGPCTGSSAT